MTPLTRRAAAVVAGLALVAAAAAVVWRAAGVIGEREPPAALPSPAPPSLPAAPAPVPVPEPPTDADAAIPAPVATPALPAPRVLPFAAGEEARYQILWKGGGAINLPAGDAIFRVEPGAALRRGGLPGYRFELMVTTAGWISAFFEARDRFWSLTGPSLDPLVHVQELHEGKRHVTRTMTFEAGRRRVIVGTGPPDALKDAVECPWVANVRDPLGAFYEARAADFDAAARHVIPVNNTGRAYTLVVDRAGETVLAAEGRSQPARLLNARLEEAGSTEPAPTAKVWLSADARRIPLAIDVEAPFGVFRIELQSYRRDAPAPAR